MNCRFCEAPLSHVFVDLGSTPLANSFLTKDQLSEPEPSYPLKAMVCAECFLVQIPQHETPENIFSEYPYFSSTSKPWVEHCKAYAEMAIQRFDPQRVIEIASNDGCLLQYFAKWGISALGIEPAENVAAEAWNSGLPTLVKFFGRETAKEVGTADLVIANNVLAHVPDLNDFVAGVKMILAPEGTVTMEFPHLLRLIEDNQFDTIYHEHFSYFGFLTAERIFGAHGLSIYDVEEIPTHGGSLRIYARHDTELKRFSGNVIGLASREFEAGMAKLDPYLGFGDRVEEAKWALLDLLYEADRFGKWVVGFGAPAKANTLLNYCEIGPDLLSFTVDETPYKQGRYLPGSHIPILGPEEIREAKPDLLWILPWNWREEIVERFSYIKEWGGRFLVANPELAVFE